MKFQAETQLVETLKNSLRMRYRRDRVAILEEVSLGYGIADIVVSDLVDTSFNDLNKEVILSHNDINIYSVIKNANRITVSEIQQITRCSPRSIKTSIDKLLVSNYVNREGDQITSHVCLDYKLPFRFNLAIEAKLKDWKRALKQAYRYRWFAEYAFVVLDAHHAKPAISNIYLFQRYNVGLASINFEGELERHFTPKRQRPFDVNMQILLSEQLKSYAFAR
jgi:predicted transcriptional regulator